MAITRDIKFQSVNPRKEGQIFPSPLDEQVIPLSSNEKIASLIAYFRNSTPLLETPLFEMMLAKIHSNGGEYKGLKDSSDVFEYYRKMDDIYSQVKISGLRVPNKATVSEMFFGKFPLNGITVEVLSGGNLSFAGRGSHRLAMSFAADQAQTPVYVTSISKSALIDRSWQRSLRRIVAY